MMLPKFNDSEVISSNEYEIIDKFFRSYKNQKIIVADTYQQGFGIIPLEDQRFVFRRDDPENKYVTFCRGIEHKGKNYVVELELESEVNNGIRCLGVDQFSIRTDEEVHTLHLNNNDDDSKRNCLLNIANIFDEGKIVSPEQAYYDRMYTNKTVQSFINNHRWDKIEEGIEQQPELANALFMIEERHTSCFDYVADFGTILYQLVSFRMNFSNHMSEKDILKLDELIFKLRKTELLMVKLTENYSNKKEWGTNSILLEPNVNRERVQRSLQFTSFNTKLQDRNKALVKYMKDI